MESFESFLALLSQQRDSIFFFLAGFSLLLALSWEWLGRRANRARVTPHLPEDDRRLAFLWSVLPLAISFLLLVLPIRPRSSVPPTASSDITNSAPKASWKLSPKLLSR